MKYQFIQSQQEYFSLERMCRLLQISRSGYYSYSKGDACKRKVENNMLSAQIRIIYDETKKSYGSPRIHAELSAKGYSCGKNRVARLMKQNGLKAKASRRVKYNPFVHYDYPAGKNCLERRFNVDQVNHVWVSDITYIPTNEGWLYLAIILDLCSRRVVGYAMSEAQRKDLVITALDQAVCLRKPPKGLTFHSDRGIQYICDQFQERLIQYGMIRSVSRRGNCYDNAVAESFFHTLKTELMQGITYQTRNEARKSLFEYIVVFYNNKRRHSHLNYLTPAEFEDLKTKP